MEKLTNIELAALKAVVKNVQMNLSFDSDNRLFKVTNVTIDEKVAFYFANAVNKLTKNGTL